MGECGERRIGWVVGESSPRESLVIFEKGFRARLGLYVSSRAGDICVLGMLERLSAGSHLLPQGLTEAEVVESVSTYDRRLLERERYLRGSVRWIVAIGREHSVPQEPVMPGSPVYEAPASLLEEVFSPKSEGYLEVGRLIGAGIPVGINVDKLARHLAILAVTGGGKSNTACVIARGIVRNYGGTVAIFDMHGEYGDLGLPGDKAVVHGTPFINPYSISLRELVRLARIPENAHNQLRLLRWAWNEARRRVAKGGIRPGEIIDFMKRVIEEYAGVDKKYVSSWAQKNGFETRPPAKRGDEAEGLLNRLDDVIESYGDVLRKDAPVELDSIIPPGKLTVFDLSGLDEEGADAVVSHYLRRILTERREYVRGGNGYPSPIIVFIEEAHVLVPRDESTLTKYWASRIAKEGRKFGVGMALISQRPRKLDPDALSQTNNKIILRMVEPRDIEYVRAASEEIGEDLASLLPSLDTGEALLIGSFTKLPAVVKIHECPYKKSGGDIPVSREWMEASSRERGIIEEVFG